ncbi:MAG: sulfatase-like hydrolase/transferase [Alphaproteobacteria bacterium]|nr:sulfatase-like hydrolase/transferase [Alphaproteobacteria bacterium]
MVAGVALVVGIAIGWVARGPVGASADAARPGPVAASSDGPSEATPAAAVPATGSSLSPAVPHHPTAPASGPFPNVLVIVADDVGQDMVGAYGVSPDPPATPTIDALAAQGVMFRHAIADPVCSPTRATLLTGRYAWRYGVGAAIPPKAGWGLPASERLLPVALDEASDGAYTSVALGKWHLATPTMGGYDHPRQAGFDHHIGTMGNLLGYVDGEPQTYFLWQRVVDGTPGVGRGYVTSATVDDAVAQVGTLPEPWFLYVAFHAAHFPMHVPPEGLYTTPLPRNPTEADLYRAMVEAMDTELGRLLAALPDDVRSRTDIVFLGDNGSAPSAVEPPWNKGMAKGSLARGGIRVPFIVTGPDAPLAGTSTDALINTTDLYATVLDWVGSDEPPPEDAISFASVLRDPDAKAPRKIAYAERFGPNGPGDYTSFEAIVRDDRYKLLVRDGEEIAMFDLVDDPHERRNAFRNDPTPELRNALRRLRHAMPDVAKVPRQGRDDADDEGTDEE